MSAPKILEEFLECIDKFEPYLQGPGKHYDILRTTVTWSYVLFRKSTLLFC